MSERTPAQKRYSASQVDYLSNDVARANAAAIATMERAEEVSERLHVTVGWVGDHERRLGALNDLYGMLDERIDGTQGRVDNLQRLFEFNSERISLVYDRLDDLEARLKHAEGAGSIETRVEPTPAATVVGDAKATVTLKALNIVLNMVNMRLKMTELERFALQLLVEEITA